MCNYYIAYIGIKSLLYFLSSDQAATLFFFNLINCSRLEDNLKFCSLKGETLHSQPDSQAAAADPLPKEELSAVLTRTDLK